MRLGWRGFHSIHDLRRLDFPNDIPLDDFRLPRRFL